MVAGSRPVQPDRNDLLRRAGQVAKKTRQSGAASAKAGSSFEGELTRALQDRKPVTFSAHAERRLRASGVTMDQKRLATLADAVDRAAQKGSRKSLVLLGQDAFVVSVPNRTVITTVNQQRMKEQVFTNIDSAVVFTQAGPSGKPGAAE